MYFIEGEEMGNLTTYQNNTKFENFPSTNCFLKIKGINKAIQMNRLGCKSLNIDTVRKFDFSVEVPLIEKQNNNKIITKTEKIK